MIKVSVIIPIYGVEKSIKRCVDSLFSQSLDSIEFIFIDDCTPDSSMELLNTVVENNCQHIEEMKWIIRFEHMQTNSGIAAVRRYGVGLATGEFVIHCDSDDWVESEMYQLLYEKAKEESADLVVCDYAINDGKTVVAKIEGCSSVVKEDYIKRLLCQKDSWSLCNKLFKRSLYDNGIIWPEGNMGEDFTLMLQLLFNSSKIAYIPRALYNYFINPFSLTHIESVEKRISFFWQNKKNVDTIFSILEAHHLSKKYSSEIIAKKWGVKKMLWDHCFDSDRKRFWKTVYQEINDKVLLNPYIVVKDKIKFCLTLLGLFP